MKTLYEMKSALQRGGLHVLTTNIGTMLSTTMYGVGVHITGTKLFLSAPGLGWGYRYVVESALHGALALIDCHVGPPSKITSNLEGLLLLHFDLIEGPGENWKGL